MIGILVITHYDLGPAFGRVAEHFFGKIPDHVRMMGVEKNHDPDERLAEAKRLIKEVDSGDGVVVLCDIFGATPANIATRLIADGDASGGGSASVVSGLNAGMLIKSIQHAERVDNPRQLAELIASAARESIRVIAPGDDCD